MTVSSEKLTFKIKSIVRREFRYLARNVRQNAPRTAAGFAVWESVET